MLYRKPILALSSLTITAKPNHYKTVICVNLKLDGIVDYCNFNPFNPTG